MYLISSHLCPERKTQVCLHMQRLSERQEKTPVPRSKLGEGDEEWGSECENRHPFCCMSFCSGSKFLNFCKFPFLSCCLSLCVYFIMHIQILLSIHALCISIVYFSGRGRDKCQRRTNIFLLHSYWQYMHPTVQPPSTVILLGFSNTYPTPTYGHLETHLRPPQLQPRGVVPG